tara:strand:+ start:535 stop:1182 length:648 start_codon:yes stop_codon:yes gene_type:complete
MAFSNGAPKPIVTKGLTSYIDSLDPMCYKGSGTTLVDLAGTANFTISGDPTYSNGYWDMDGSGDIFTCSNDLGSPTTVSNDFWINIEGETNNTRNINSSGTNKGVARWSIYLTTNTTLRLYRGGYQNCSTALSTSAWNYVCITNDGTTTNFYINGALSNSESQNVSKSAQSTFIIADGYNGNFNGRMGPHRMYNRILNASEVLQNFNAQRGRFGV